MSDTIDDLRALRKIEQQERRRDSARRIEELRAMERRGILKVDAVYEDTGLVKLSRGIRRCECYTTTGTVLQDNRRIGKRGIDGVCAALGINRVVAQ